MSNLSETGEKPRCDVYDVPMLKAWLEFQAMDGKCLIDTAGRTFYFRKGEAKRVFYRLEVLWKKKWISEGEKEQWRKKGWEYVVTYRKLYHIFRSETEMWEEEDCAAASRMASLRKNKDCIIIRPFAGAVLLIIIALFFFWILKEDGTFLASMYGAGFYMLLALILTVIMTIYSFYLERKLRNAIRAVQNGEMADETAFQSYLKKTGTMVSVLHIIADFFLIGIMVCNFATCSERLTREDAVFPVFLAEELEGELYMPKLRGNMESVQHYKKTFTPFAEENIRAEQEGFLFESREAKEAYINAAKSSDGTVVEDRKLEELEAAQTAVSLELQYYDARSEKAAKGILESMVSHYVSEKAQKADAFQNGIYGFNEAYLLQMADGEQILCAVMKDQAFFLRYRGDLDLSGKLEWLSSEFSKKAADSNHK